jgi:anti-anti-sigma regulatory factor
MTVFRMAYDDGAVRITSASTPGVLAIAGEIDECGHAGLVKTLSELTAGHREIHIRLGGVAFCDLAGLRAIILLTRPSNTDHTHTGARLVLHETPPQLAKILQILGWDTSPGLVIQEPDQHCPPDCHAASTAAGGQRQPPPGGPAGIAITQGPY